VRFIISDILEYQGEDLSGGCLQVRLSALNDLRAKTEIGQSMRVEESCALGSWDEFSTKLAQARDLGARGLVLRHRDSVYLDSVSKNLSFLAAPNPRFLNAILLYAEKGKYSQDGLFDEFTFAVQEGDSLVPVAKISEGISEAELLFLQGWIKSNTKERFGPVRSLEPKLVFRLGFESVVSSSRHRSKIALIGAHVVERLSEAGEVSGIEELREASGKNPVSADFS
jgi:DNA ligase-1